MSDSRVFDLQPFLVCGGFRVGWSKAGFLAPAQERMAAPFFLRQGDPLAIRRRLEDAVYDLDDVTTNLATADVGAILV